MKVGTKIHIAADWEEDQSAVNQIYKWNEEQEEVFSLTDSSELLEDMESEWSCFAKTVLKSKVQEADIFLLVVGEDTISVKEGGCPLCENYRSFSGNCAHGRTTDKRGFIEFQCAMALEFNKKIIVLYHADSIDKSKCPFVIRETGSHFAMKSVKSDGKTEWNLSVIMEQCLSE